ncbi:MAG: polysaccharide export protein [Oceanospirillales bacterium]|uniref:Polysaccharide export outer membrane protein n=1 Tax=Marinobacterium halophilum TaxID=267374 RepID=A0A2P8F239_9GAMM|nr:polysaccharide biosynthesis/export family protein [Marinobacterium halophilum]MBR9827622.1 polysaccharide export protein [Oceanospirillales bacterium]PSL15780.1 polysaccharide export outer membrane protein [Marinobacterium halophilum]
MFQSIFSRTLLLIALLFSSLTAWSAGNSQYTLGSGDVISINVFGEEDLTFEQIRLNDAGIFSYPFLGEVRANGRTAIEIESIIIRGLKGDYLIDPKVSVSILEYRDFFVNGEVKAPGGYPFKPGLTLRKAVALAGGLSERASESKISIIREEGANKRTFKATMDTPVMPGDIITIDQSFF